MYAEMYKTKISQIVTLMAIDNHFGSEQGLVFIKKPLDYVENVVERVKLFKKMQLGLI